MKVWVILDKFGVVDFWYFNSRKEAADYLCEKAPAYRQRLLEMAGQEPDKSMFISGSHGEFRITPLTMNYSHSVTVEASKLEDSHPL